MGFWDLAVKSSTDVELWTNSAGLWKFGVGACYFLVVTINRSICNDLQSLPLADHDVFLIVDVFQGNFWTLSVKHDCTSLLWSLFEGNRKVFKTLSMCLLISLRKIDSCNFHSRIQHLDDLVDTAVVWPKSQKWNVRSIKLSLTYPKVATILVFLWVDSTCSNIC